MTFLGMANFLQVPHLFLPHDFVVCSFGTNLDSDDLATCAAKEVVLVFRSQIAIGIGERNSFS